MMQQTSFIFEIYSQVLQLINTSFAMLAFVCHKLKEGIKVTGWEKINYYYLTNEPEHVGSTKSISCNVCSSSYDSKQMVQARDEAFFDEFQSKTADSLYLR